MQVISGRAEKHGKIPGVFISSSVTDFFSLQVWAHAQYVTSSPSDTTDSSSVFNCFASGKYKSSKDFTGKFSFGYSASKPSYQTAPTSIQIDGQKSK